MALNQPWVLEFQHHWGTGARVVRGTKCGVYNRKILHFSFLSSKELCGWELSLY